jgi:hypothetical protein
VLSAVIAVVIFALVVALVIAVARDPGPPAEDVAVAYEDAWDRLDFEALWALSGDELRDGMDRRAFIAAKREAYQRQAPELENLAADVAVEHLDAGRHAAVVRTRVDARGGGETRNEIQLAHRAGKWVVVGYHLLGPGVSGNPLGSSG